MTRKPILCLDFDGVIHSYTSGWQGADVIPDPPVPGAIDFIIQAHLEFRVAIYSSRSGQPGGIEAMQAWLWRHTVTWFHKLYSSKLAHERAELLLGRIEWPTDKPPAMVTLDDRALTFKGTWPDIAELRAFEPWTHKRVAGGKPSR
jgi:hypothetical protein